MPRPHLHRVLLCLGASCAALLVVVLVTGGIEIPLAYGMRFRAHGLAIPLGLGLVSLALSFAIGGRRVAADIRESWSTLDRAAAALALCAAVAILGLGDVFSTRVAAGSDAYGYISQAVLWTEGRLHVSQPIAERMPWPRADWTVTPLGYRPVPPTGTIVPTYPPGLPLVMAAFLKIGGPFALFLVVPLLGAAAVWLTFSFADTLCGPAGGLAAAILTACSPIFLFQLFQPLSDVPATTWWLAAVVAATRGWHPLLAGAFSSAAVLTRPNLAPLALVVALMAMFGARADLKGRPLQKTGSSGSRSRMLTVLMIGVGLLPGVIATAWINRALYGSALVSGYGTISALFSWANVIPNLRLYSRWLVETQTLFPLLALAAPVALWAAGAGASTAPLHRAATRAWLSLAFVVLLVGCYLPYGTFDSWTYLRFLLPGLPVAISLSVATAVVLLRRVPSVARAPALIFGCLALAAWYINVAVDRQAFALKELENRYVETGTYVKQHLPANAVILSVQESGSVRHYSGRLSLRWDDLDREWLDTAMTWLRGEGYQPYMLLEAWEEPEFRARFRGHSEIAELDWPPVAQFGRQVRVRLYDPGARSRFFDSSPLPSSPR